MNVALSQNSTSVALGSGETFTGVPQDITRYNSVTCSGLTDQDGTLFMEFSMDGTHWDSSVPFAVTANKGFLHRLTVLRSRYRVRYVNGAGAQTFFRMQCLAGDKTLITASLGGNIPPNSDAILVRTINADLDLQRGTLEGMAAGDKFGYSSGLGTAVVQETPSSHVDLWAYGGQRTSPSGTFTPFMASDDAGDTGINIEWTYLDASGLEQSVTVTTDSSDGRTPVSLGVTATEVYRGENVGATALAGDIACTTVNNYTNGAPDDDTEVLAVIPALDGKTQVLAGRVPADEEFLLRDLNVYLSRNSGSAGNALLRFQTRKPGGIFVSQVPFSVSTAAAVLQDMSSIKLDPGTDYRVRIIDVSDNASTINGRLTFFRVKV